MGLRQSQITQHYNSRLHRAISRRDVETTRYLLEQAKVDVNQVEDGKAPISIAIYGRNDDIVDLLIEAGCRLDPDPECDFVLLHQAVFMGHLKYVKLLLEKGCSVNARDKEGQTALHVLMSFRAHGTAPTILNVLNSYGIDINAQNNSGQTALHICARLNDTDNAQRLAQIPGCDLNVRSENGSTPLMLAAEQGYGCLVALLLRAGCDTEVANVEGLTPLLVTITRKRHGLLNLLLERGADKNKQVETSGMSPLHYAVQLGDKFAVCRLLQHDNKGHDILDADVNVADHMSRTPLVLASALANQGHPETAVIVRRLLEAGADVTRCNIEGYTPLHQAANYGRLETAQILVDAGASVVAEDRTGKTPLLKAAAEGHVDIVSLLLAHGALVNHRDGRGRTALYLAAQQARTDTMALLLNAGAMMDLADKEGNAPLHCTVRFPSLHPQSLWQLVQRRCDPVNLDGFLQWILVNEILPKTVLFAETDLESWYLLQKRTPKTLRHLCRVAIHRALGIGQRDVPRVKVARLPLPASLVDYVSLKLL